MSESPKLNLDTSVLFNYLYSTTLVRHTEGEAEFEHNRGCREYFESPDFWVVAGGKAIGEFTSGCNRRHVMYDDMVSFLRETDKEIFDYEPKDRDIHTSPNDQTHARRGVQFSLANKDVPGQLSTTRRAHQQITPAMKDVLEDLDDDHGQFTHDDLRDAIESRLDIGHDCDVLVDAAHIARDHSIPTLAALDSDITNDDHQTELNEIIHAEFDPSVTVTTIDPEEDELN